MHKSAQNWALFFLSPNFGVMESVDIKDISGNLRFSTSIGEGSKRKYTLQKEDYITLKFSLDTPIQFNLGDYVNLPNDPTGLFELIDLYKPAYNTTTGGYDYELRLDAYYMKWKNKKFFHIPETGSSETAWSLTASLDTHMSVFLRNLIALGYTYKGKAFELKVDESVSKALKLIQYDNTNLVDALTKMAETFECEWWVIGHEIHFGKRQNNNTPIDFELAVNVSEMTRSDSKDTYATRIYAFGSTRNIPSTYRKKLAFDVTTVNGRDISDDIRVLNPKFFPKSALTTEDPKTASFQYDAVEKYTGKATLALSSSLPALRAGEYNIHSDLELTAWGYQASTPFRSDLKTVISLTYTSNGAEKTIPVYTKDVNAVSQNSVTVRFEDLQFKLEEDAGNCVLSIKTGAWLGASEKDIQVGFEVHGGISFSRTAQGASITVTFLSGVNNGKTFDAIYNPEFRAVKEGNIIRLPEGVTAAVKDQFTINNIIKGAVSGSYFTGDAEGSTANSIAQRRLMLPVDTPYVDAYENMSQEEAVVDVITFDDIFPHLDGVISHVSHVDKDVIVDDKPTGETYPVYTFKDSTLKNFDENFVIDSLKIIFQTGSLSGMEFTVDWKSTDDSGTTFEIVPNEDYGPQLPNRTLFPEEASGTYAGDTYVLSGYDTSFVSETMVPNAEKELLEKAREYVAKSKIDPSTYDNKMMSDYVKGLAKAPEVGDRVNLVNKAYFENGRQSRIIGFEYSLDIPYDNPVYTVGETASYSRISELESKVGELIEGQKYAGGGSTYLIKKVDSTVPSDENAYSALRSKLEMQENNERLKEVFLTKTEFGNYFTKVTDDFDTHIETKYGLVSKQYLSCGGNNPGTGGSGTAGSFGQLVNVGPWADEIPSVARIAVQEAGATHWTSKNLSDIVGLDTRALGEYLSTNKYVTQNWVSSQGYLTEHQSLADYATKNWVTSQGYLTEHQSLADYATQSWVSSQGFAKTSDLALKVDKVDGMGLSQNNFTNTLKSKLDGLSNYILPVAKAAILGGVMVGSTLMANAQGVLNMKDAIVSPDTYTKVVVDTYGRVTGGGLLSESDIPNISLSKVTGLQSELNKKVDKTFLAKTFGFMENENSEIAINDDSKLVKYLKIKVGAWSEEFLSTGGMNQGSGGSSGIDERMLWSILGNTGTEQIAKNHLTSALNGYATESFVTQKGYITAASLADYARKSDLDALIGTGSFPTVTGYNTVKGISNILYNFIQGSDLGSTIDNWKEFQKVFENFPDSANMIDLLKGKVDVRSGYGLSQNDFTNALKTKLDGLSNYTLPVASATVLGGVKIGSNIAINNGVISVQGGVYIPESNTTVYMSRGSAGSIAGPVPSATELTDSSFSGSKHVQYTGASGHLIQFRSMGSAAAVQLYTTYYGSMIWRASTNNTLSGKPWKTFIDSSNYTSWLVPKTGGTYSGSVTVTGKLFINRKTGDDPAYSLTIGDSTTGLNHYETGGIELFSSGKSVGYWSPSSARLHNVYFRTPTANRYDALSLMINGNGSGLYSGIGFHQPGVVSGMLLMNDNGQFSFQKGDGSAYADIYSANVTAGNGYLYSNYNGCRVQIGSQNSSHVHFMNNASRTYFFDNGMFVKGHLVGYDNGVDDLGVSQKRWRDLFLSGDIRMETGKSIKLGNGTIEWDEEHKSFKFTGGVYATTYLSCGGANQGSGGSGGGIIQSVYGYADLGKTYNNTILFDTFNAYTINQLASRIKTLENTTLTSVPWGIVAGKPTTLSGYGITDAMTLNTDQTITANKTFNNGLSARGNRFNDYLAYYENSNSSVTGTICITLPNGWASSMNTYEIYVYEYDSRYGGSKILVSGYNYNGGYWANHKASIEGSYNKSIRLAYNGTKCCILLGNTSTVWGYPFVCLRSVYTSHSNAGKWQTGYSISLITSESGYSAIATPALADAHFNNAVINNNQVLHAGNYSRYLDSRYYTESESDSRFVKKSGDTMTGVLKVTEIYATNGNGLVMYSGENWTYLGMQIGTTYIRSGAADLIHRKNRTDYSVIDTSNITSYVMRHQGRVVNDFNAADFRVSGSYGLNSAPANGPVSGIAYGSLIVSNNIDTGLQIIGGYVSNRLAFRGWGGSGSTYTRWNEVLSDNNYTSYTVTKTGAGASGTWGINVSGSASSIQNVSSQSVTYSLESRTVVSYNTQQVTAGLFPAIDNANAILTVSRHPGNYYSQLGFSGNGNLYYRSFSNEALNTTKAWNMIWNSGNDGSGSGLDADLLDGYHGSSSATANTYVRRDANNYIYTNYINSSTSNNENPVVSQFIITNGDNYYRKASLNHVIGQLSHRQQTLDLSSYDSNKWYPCWFHAGSNSGTPTRLVIFNGLRGNKPSWGTHASGFSLLVDMACWGAGWGAMVPNYYLDRYKASYGGETAFGGTQQNTMDSKQIVWLRGGAVYYYWLNTGATVASSTSGYSWTSGTYSYSAAPRTTQGNYYDGFDGYTLAYISGNVASASKWQTARTITLTGAVTGSVSIDGTGNVSLATTYQAANIGNLDARYVNVTGDTVTGTLNYNNRLYVSNVGHIVPYSTYTRQSGVYGVYDSYKIAHIWSMGESYKIADDGSNFGNLYGFAYKHTNNSTGGTMAEGHMAVWCQNGVPKVALGSNLWVALNASIGGNLTVDGTITGNLSGNSTTATRLQTARTIALSGGATGTATSFNGSSNISIPVTAIDPSKSLYKSGSMLVKKIVAHYTNDNNTATGMFKIVLPTGWSSSMMGIEIDLYNYNGLGYSKILVGGYNYSGGSSWINTSVSILGGYDYPVRLGYDGSKCCILIGNVGYAWHIPKVVVRNVISGYSGYASLDGTWSIALVNSESGLLSLSTPTINANMTVQTARNAGVLTTGRTINGTSFNGSANITTAMWGTARYIYVSDYSGANTGAAVSVNGGANVTLKMPTSAQFSAVSCSGRSSMAGLTVGYANTSFALSTSSFICDSWVRTNGNTGWFNQTYQGGIYMTDTTWVRVYNNKSFLVESGTLQIGSIRLVYDSANKALKVVMNDGTNGNLYATGGISCGGFNSSTSSDARLKENFSEVRFDDMLLRMGRVRMYNYNDLARNMYGLDNDRHIGLIHQQVKEVLPSMTSVDANGYGRLDYLDKEYINLIAGACQLNTLGIRSLVRAQQTEAQKLEKALKRIGELEEEVKQLKSNIDGK